MADGPDKPDGRRRMSAQQRRDQLLDILAGIILAEGYPAVSIDRVARDAQIARTVVYSHFANLEALHLALAQRTELRVLAQVRAIVPDIDDDGDPDEMTVEAFAAFTQSVAADPATWRLALSPRDGAPIALRQRADATRAAILALMVPPAAEGLRRRGGPADLDPEILAHLVLAGAEEGGRIVLADPRPETIERLTTFARTALRALGTS